MGIGISCPLYSIFLDGTEGIEHLIFVEVISGKSLLIADLGDTPGGSNGATVPQKQKVQSTRTYTQQERQTAVACSAGKHGMV